jgi:hypothetical protein
MIVTNWVRLVTSTPSQKLKKKIVRLLAFVSLISADGTENRLFFLITLSGERIWSVAATRQLFDSRGELFAIKEAIAKGRSA